MNNFYLSPEGDRYYLGTQFTYDGRVYIGTTETFATLGFTLVVVDPMPNGTYYIVGSVNDDGTWNYTERSLPSVQDALITNANAVALSTLQSTDWYVIRESENGTPVPTEYTNWRQSVRDAASEYESLVSAAPDVTTIENDIGSTVTFPPAPGGNGIINIYVEGTSGNDLLTVLGTEDPANPGTYLPLTEAQFSQFGVGMYLNKFGSIVDGLTITEVLAPTGQIRVSANLSGNLSAVAPVFDWADYDAPVISGTLSTGRSGNDMNPSYYTAFTSEDPDITGADTYLYQPTTATTMPYLPSLVPPGFDSFGDCFNDVDFTLQIKFGAAVIATITCPLGANTPIPFST